MRFRPLRAYGFPGQRWNQQSQGAIGLDPKPAEIYHSALKVKNPPSPSPSSSNGQLDALRTHSLVMNHFHELESAKMEMEELPLQHPSPGSAFRHADPPHVRSRTTRAFGAAPGVLLSILSFIKPSFIVPHSSEPRKLHLTSYLDGLRGVAALFVVFAHYQATFFPYLGAGWHQKGQREDGTEKANNYIVQFPIIRTFYAARFMVSIFFVISGYVLSQKSLGEFAYPFLYYDLVM
jgi:hypothetical protein